MVESIEPRLVECSEEDLETLVKISKHTFVNTFQEFNDPNDFNAYVEKAFTSQQILSELNNPDSAFYFVKVKDQIAGYLKLNFGPAQTEFKEPETMEIERIYANAEFQGKGIGKLMMDFAIKQARSKSMEYIWLGVWEHNPKAIAFYRKYDFYQFDKHSFKLGTDLQTDILMKLDLVYPTN